MIRHTAVRPRLSCNLAFPKGSREPRNKFKGLGTTQISHQIPVPNHLCFT